MRQHLAFAVLRDKKILGVFPTYVGHDGEA